MKTRMSDKEKGEMITKIMVEMKSEAILQDKAFDEGVFFDLAFMSDKELLRISKLCNIR